MLLFGRIQQSDENELLASLDERVVISPFVAKRLQVMLNGVVRQVESTDSILDRKIAPQNQGQASSLLNLPPFQFRLTAERVTSLFQLLSDLNLRVAFERSFKLSQEMLFGGRFLVGIKKNMIRTEPTIKILEICKLMEMPQDLLARFNEMLPEARVVGFGFGENETSCVAKAYLEFTDTDVEDRDNETDKSDSYLSHLGFKWDAADNSRSTLATYTCFPLLTAEEMLERLSSNCYRQHVERPLKVVEGIVEWASKKAGSKALHYLEVNEKNNPRSSFDINIYGANLRLEDLHPFFLDMCHHYSISDQHFHDLYEPIKTKICGHLGGGNDGKGKDFLTVYFGD
jgi:hypothetical protein